jgi:hypothetical protein
VQVDALAVRLRPRTPLEAADLGVRLCQGSIRTVYACYAVVLIPVAVCAFATYEIASWLPALVLWWLKPWLDRTILFVLSRAAFGQQTTVAHLWKAQRQVWWSQLLITLTIRRLSPWRSLTQPVYQLEGIPLTRIRPRIQQIRRTKTGSAILVTAAFTLASTALGFSLASFMVWFAPPAQAPDLVEIISDGMPASLTIWITIAFATAAAAIEPFYVAAGFGMYLSRRAELEAWDIEQEFKRAFPAHTRAAALLLAAVTIFGSAMPALAQSPSPRPTDPEITRALEEVRADPNLSDSRTIRTLRWIDDGQRRSTPGWIRWLIGLFRWISQSARVLVWATVAILAVMLGVYVAGLLQGRKGQDRDDGRFVTPTHVRDLDIRPESLPDDIGAAALALWSRGDRRAALALLYRGLLSRLAHVHKVPIRDSSTEGDCLTLSTQLPGGPRDYTARLVPVWQRAVYGGQYADPTTVQTLCADFSDALDARTALTSGGPQA